MKVALVRDEFDARTFKLRSALLDAGLDANEFVRFVGYHGLYGSYASPDRTKRYRFYYDGSRFEFLLRHLAMPNALSYRHLAERLADQGYRVFHANSVTDHLAAGLIRHGSTPVITEVYDSTSLYEVKNLRAAFSPTGSSPRGTRSRLVDHIVANALEWERLSHEEAAGLVYTSREMLEYAKSMYQVRCPTVIVPNAVYGKLLPRSPPPHRLSETEGGVHLVYVGVIRDSPGGHHRDICASLDGIARQDTIVHLYPLIPESEEERVKSRLGSNPNIRWHSPITYQQLYRELPMFDAGLILLAPFDVELLNVALPNKIFEYAAAGLPVFVSPYKPLLSFIQEFNCGRVIQDLESTGDRVRSWRIPFRPEFTIEHYIPALSKLYSKVAA